MGAAIFCPIWFLRSAMPHTGIKNIHQRNGFLVLAGFLFYLIPVFLICEIFIKGMRVFAIWWYLCFVALLATFRFTLRGKFNLDGDYLQDFFGAMILYPLIVEQIDVHFRNLGLFTKVTDASN